MGGGAGSDQVDVGGGAEGDDGEDGEDFELRAAVVCGGRRVKAVVVVVVEGRVGGDRQ